jgi:hypothetical protein
MADYVAPSIRKNLALTSPTSGRLVGIVRPQTQAMEVVCSYLMVMSVTHSFITSNRRKISEKLIWRNVGHNRDVISDIAWSN